MAEDTPPTPPLTDITAPPPPAASPSTAQSSSSDHRERFWTYTAAISSASVTILAFLIPSIQAQWDRYEARQVIEQYVEFGDDCVRQEKYDVAEKAYDKAFELSLQTRLDIDMKRLKAKVGRMSVLKEWGSKPPKGLEDVDFQLLLHLQDGPKHRKERAITMISYASFLAATGKAKQAEAILREGIRENPTIARLHLNLGNLQDQIGQRDAALASYKKALELEPKNAVFHYNLGLLYLEMGQFDAAIRSLEESQKLEPDPLTEEHLKQAKSRQVSPAEPSGGAPTEPDRS